MDEGFCSWLWPVFLQEIFGLVNCQVWFEFVTCSFVLSLRKNFEIGSHTWVLDIFIEKPSTLLQKPSIKRQNFKSALNFKHLKLMTQISLASSMQWQDFEWISQVPNYNENPDVNSAFSDLSILFKKYYLKTKHLKLRAN